MKDKTITIKDSQYTKAILEQPIPEFFINKTWDDFKYLKNEPARDWFIEAINGSNYTVEIKDLQIYTYPLEIQKKNKDGSDSETIMPIGVACIVRIEVPSLGVIVEETGACSASNITREKTFNAFDTCVKGAVSDGFKRCLRYFGPGRELYPDSDFAKNPSKKNFVPQLPLMGLTTLSTLLNISMADMVRNIESVYGMEKITLSSIPDDPELARDLLNKAKAIYLRSEETNE